MKLFKSSYILIQQYDIDEDIINTIKIGQLKWREVFGLFYYIMIPMLKGKKKFYITDVIVNRIEKWVVDMEKSF